MPFMPFMPVRTSAKRSAEGLIADGRRTLNTVGRWDRTNRPQPTHKSCKAAALIPQNGGLGPPLSLSECVQANAGLAPFVLAYTLRSGDG